MSRALAPVFAGATHSTVKWCLLPTALLEIFIFPLVSKKSHHD